MILKKKGNYQMPGWKLEDVICTAEGGYKKSAPCYSVYDIEKNDIIRIIELDDFCDIISKYGFICQECFNFTEVDKKLIPKEVKASCLTIAKKSCSAYLCLTDVEKELSDKFFKNYHLV